MIAIRLRLALGRRSLRRTLSALAGLAISAAALPTPAAAQRDAYPTRPVRMIVPYAPGGGADIVGRIFGMCLGNHLGQPVVVENKAGAGGTIGADAAAKAAADGYTIVLHTLSSIVLNNFLYTRLPYNPRRDFAPVSEIGHSPNVLAVRKDLSVTTVPDLIALARREPGRLTYGSGGNGTIVHLSAVLLARQAGIELTHVPYRGGGPSLNALMAGEVDMMIDAVPVMLPQIREGMIKAIAVTSPARVPLLPQVPTMQEAGLPNYETQNWYGLFVPSGTPGTVIGKLEQASIDAVKDAACRTRLAEIGVNVVGSSAGDFRIQWEQEMRFWEPVIRESGARLD